MDLTKLPVGDNAPHEVNVVIEIPAGSSNKVEYRPEWEAFVVDRTLFSPLYYPCNYGFVPSTLFDDGDPLDILVVSSQPLAMGAVVLARPLGLLKMHDDKGPDHKVISVFAHDPRYEHFKQLSNLSEHRRREIVHFFEIYKQLEDKAVDVEGWHPAAEAHKVIQKSVVKR